MLPHYTRQNLPGINMGKTKISFFKRSTPANDTTLKTDLQNLEDSLLRSWVLDRHKLQGSIIIFEHDEGKIGFCCIAVNQTIEIEKIQPIINDFLQKNPDTPLIMLGTVQYPTSKFPAMQILSQLPIQGVSEHIVIANSDMDSGFCELVEGIVEQQQLSNRQRLSLWGEAKIKYTEGMANLSQDKQQKLQTELAQLEESIINGLDKEKSITQFIDNTKIILAEESHPFFNLVLKIAAVVIVTLFAGAIGYGIGLTLCSYYPSLFIVPFLGAAETPLATLAATTAFPACVGAGLACDALFKPKESGPASQDVNELIGTVRSTLQTLF